ncbi:unnamed protein product [Coregonus sp. 'balchen']|nr:unnamed protein product [Coregonus sp. 'balchen']
MGSGSSRGKKVVPASVNETNSFKRDDSTVHVLKEERHLFKPLTIPKSTNLSQSRNRAQQDCHSEGHDSEFSAEDDDIDVELNRVLEEYDNRELRSKRKTTQKKPFIRSKTYGLCHSNRVHNDSDFNSTPHSQSYEFSKRPGACCPDNCSVGVKDKKGIPVFDHFCKDTQIQFSSGTQENVRILFYLILVSVLDDSHGPSLSMPVILYDGSEVDMMETIEREFS